MQNKPKTLLDCLIELQNGNIPCPDCGICSNLDQLSDYNIGKGSAFVAIQPYIQTWPANSGNDYYPIRSQEQGYSASEYYSKCKEDESHWTGDYGDLRKDLLNHIINEIRKEGN